MRHCSIFVLATRLSVSCLMLGLVLSPSQARADQALGDFQRVVVAADALPVTKYAAHELAHYAGLISGRGDLPVVEGADAAAAQPGLSFFVGQKAGDAAAGATLSPWKREEWMIRSIPKGLILAGDDAAGNPISLSVAAGSQLAVYTLLDDHLGVRWFWPGPTGEHVPVNPKAVIPSLDQRELPRFIIRSYSLGYTSYQTKQFREESRVWGRRTRQGWIPAATFGHSWFYAFDLRKTGAENPYFKAHPEWFALVNGKRRPPQMCTSNPQVIQHMVDYVLADTKRAITTISPSDGGGFCQCDEETKSDLHKRLGIPSCTSMDVPGLVSYDGKSPQLSDRIFTYANEIARRVREKQPDKGVGMFAYTFYNKPPVHIKKLEPNLYLSFVFQAQAHLDPIARQEWLDSIAGWQKLGAKMVVREGWGNHYLLDLPFIYEKQIHSSLQTAAELGFIAAYGEGSKSFATQAPNTWAVVRTMWNPQIDHDAMMQDFYSSAYGPASDAMRHYFETYSTALQDNWPKRRFIMDTRGVPYVNLINSWHIILPMSVVDQAETYLKQAEQLAPAGEYGDRVHLHRIGQDYARCMFELLDDYRELAELGLPMDFFKLGVETPRNDPARLQVVLKRAYELGELREDMLLKYRDLPAADEGLYAITSDRGMRQWHVKVKAMLHIDKPTRINKALLAAGDKTDVEPAAKPIKPVK